jgi:hypothetical protein
MSVRSKLENKMAASILHIKSVVIFITLKTDRTLKIECEVYCCGGHTVLLFTVVVDTL